MFLTKNSAFRRGFVAGIRSPYEMFGLRATKLQYRPVNLVALSWLQVGQSMKQAMSEEDRVNGKGNKPSIQAH